MTGDAADALLESLKNILGAFIDVCTARIFQVVLSQGHLKKRDFSKYTLGDKWVSSVLRGFWFQTWLYRLKIR